MFSELPFYSWVIIRTIFSLKNLVRYLWTSKHQITLRMIILKHNSLKSDIFFNSIFIPCFLESRFFRVQVFWSSGYSVSRFFRVLVWVRVQVLEVAFEKWSWRNLVKDTINFSQLFIFTNVIRCSRLPLCVGYFICFKFTRSSIVH